MRDPKWMGSFPSQHYWSEDGNSVYFMWNLEKAAADSLYQISREELRLIATLKKRQDDSDKAKKQRQALEPKRPKKVYLGKKKAQQIKLSPDEKFVTFRLNESPKDARTAQVPSYITESGFTEEISTRLKVGEPTSRFEFGIYDVGGAKFLVEQHGIDPKRLGYTAAATAASSR